MRLPVEVFEQFSALLTKRFELRVPTTEDSIRYTFFAALINGGFQPEQVVIEFKHPSIPGAEVDTVLLADSGAPAIALEFKYDRVANSTSPKPQKAGALFADVSRLLRFTNVLSRYFVYVTDTEMAEYLDKSDHGLQKFFRLQSGDSLIVNPAFLKVCPLTFHKRMGSWAAAAKLHAVWSQELPMENQVRIYEVSNAAAATV